MRIFIGFEAPAGLVRLHREIEPMLCRYLGGRHPTCHQPLHLTVKSPFEMERAALKGVLKSLESIAEYERPFEVRVHPAAHFERKFIHYPLDGTILRDTIDQILSVLEDHGVARGTFDGQKPHVTFVNAAMSEREFDRAFELCRDTHKPRRVELQKIVVYEKRDERWHPWWSEPLRSLRAA